jgi:hypothetical protein
MPEKWKRCCSSLALREFVKKEAMYPDGRTTSVPHHRGRDLARPLIKEILREIELSSDEYEEYLKML